MFLIRENPCLSVANSFILCLCGFISENKLHLREQIEQRLARIDDRVVRRAKLSQIRRAIAVRGCVDVAKAASRFQRRRAEGERHIID
jgi:hypothetical protein